jgi:hypothetical protein
MQSSIQNNIGISVKLKLNFKNIDIIIKLLSTDAQLIIYGLSKPIAYDFKFNDDEYKLPYFDNRILQILSKFKNEKEFIEYASKVAEIRSDKMVLRKKINYINFDDKQEIYDYFDFFEYNDDIDRKEEKNYSNYNKEKDKKNLIKKYKQSSYNYVNCNLNKIKISFLFYVNLLQSGISVNSGNTKNLSNFVYNIDRAINFFNNFGIDKEKLSIFNNNILEKY